MNDNSVKSGVHHSYVVAATRGTADIEHINITTILDCIGVYGAELKILNPGIEV